MSNRSFLPAALGRAAVTLTVAAAMLAVFPLRTLAAPVDDLQVLLARYEKEAKAEDYPSAEKTARQMLAIGQRSFATNHLLMVRIAGLLADSCSSQEKYAEAERYYRYVAQLRERISGADSVEVASALHNLADMQWNQEQYAAAAATYGRALAIRERRLGANHADTLFSRKSVAECQEKLDAPSTDKLAAALEQAEQRFGRDDPRVLASLMSLAAHYRVEGQADEAEALEARAIAIIGKVPQDKDTGLDSTALRKLGRACESRQRYAEAERLFRRAVAVAEKEAGDNSTSLIYSLEGLGDICLDIGRYNDAEQCARRTLALREKALGADHVDVAFSLGELANVYSTVGRYAEAEALYKRGLALREQHLRPNENDYHLVATMLHNLGTLYYRLERFSDAEPVVRRALGIREQAFGPEHRLVAETMVSLGAILRSQGRADEAIPIYERALAIREKALGPDHIELVTTLSNLGNYRSNIGQYDDAAALYDRALQIQIRALGEDSPDVAETRIKIGSLESNRGHPDEAQKLYEAALASLEKAYGRDNPALVDCLTRLAALHYHEGRFGPAAELVDRAIAIADRAGLGASDRYDCYFLRARINWQANERSEAAADLRRAMDLAEQQRGYTTGAEVERARYFNFFAEAFERMVEWQAELGDTSEAFAAIERARARSLLDELNMPGVDLQIGRSPMEREALRRQEQELRGKIAELKQRTRDLEVAGADPGKRDAAAGELAAARAALYEHYREARSTSPVYRNLLASGSGRTRVSQVQRVLLGERGLMLEYLFGERASYVLAIDGRQARLVRLEIADEEAATLGLQPGPLLAAGLRQALMNDDGNGVLQQLADAREAEAAAPKLAALWRTLVPEEKRQALTNGQHDRLIVVPDGPLALLPMETLVVKEGTEVEYLLDVGPPIQYGPSATVLVNLQGRSAGPDAAGVEPVLTVGDPAVGAPPVDQVAARGGRKSAPTADAVEPAATVAARGFPGALTRLPHAAQESSWVAEIFRRAGVASVKLVDREATEAQVRARAAGRHIVHLACHGLADQEHGNFFGALALAPGTDAATDAADDGLLTLPEIYELDLHRCDLAILSACETNYGPEQQGEGVWALSRGFLVAGARRVVASDWLVDDEAAASIVSYFCGNLAKAGAEPDYAQALQAAKRAARKQAKWRSPYYWAPLVLVGPR